MYSYWQDRSEESRKEVKAVIEKIRQRAYFIYLETGSTDEVDNWVKAEDEICISPLEDYTKHMESLPADALEPKKFVRTYGVYDWD